MKNIATNKRGNIMNWDYLQPVTIRFGKGRVKEIKEIARSLDCKRGILVAGPFF